MRANSFEELYDRFRSRRFQLPILSVLLMRACCQIYHARYKARHFVAALGPRRQKIHYAVAQIEVNGLSLESKIVCHLSLTGARLCAEASLYPRIKELFLVDRIPQTRLLETLLKLLPTPQELRGEMSYQLMKDLANLFGWPAPEFEYHYHPRSHIVRVVGSFPTPFGNYLTFGERNSEVQAQEAAAQEAYQLFWRATGACKNGLLEWRSCDQLELSHQQLFRVADEASRRLPVRESLVKRLAIKKIAPADRRNQPPKGPNMELMHPVKVTDYMEALRRITRHPVYGKVVAIEHRAGKKRVAGGRMHRQAHCIGTIAGGRHYFKSTHPACCRSAQQIVARKMYEVVYRRREALVRAAQRKENSA